MSIFISEELDIIEVKFSFVVQIGRFWHFTRIYFKVEFTPTIYTQIKSPQVFRDFVCISYMRTEEYGFINADFPTTSLRFSG